MVHPTCLMQALQKRPEHASTVDKLLVGALLFFLYVILPSLAGGMS